MSRKELDERDRRLKAAIDDCDFFLRTVGWTFVGLSASIVIMIVLAWTGVLPVHGR